MTEAQALEAIGEAFVNAWVAAQPSVPIVLENEAASSVEQWCRLSVAHTVRNQATLGAPGARRFESRGYISVQLFGKINIGRGPLSVLADAVRTILESANLPQRDVNGNPIVGADTVETFGARTVEVRDPKDAGTWYMLNVMVPFRYWQQR